MPCAQIYSIEDIFGDAQFAARENMFPVDDARAGALVLPSAVPRLSETPPTFRHAGRALGADNDLVYGEWLGLSAEEVGGYRARGVI